MQPRESWNGPWSAAGSDSATPPLHGAATPLRFGVCSCRLAIFRRANIHTRNVARWCEWSVMKTKLTIRILTLTAILAVSACTTVVEERKPVTTSTTTTEETISHNPAHQSTTTQTTRTQTR